MPAMIRNLTIIAAVAIFCVVLLNSSSNTGDGFPADQESAPAMLAGTAVLGSQAHPVSASAAEADRTAAQLAPLPATEPPLELTIPALPLLPEPSESPAASSTESSRVSRSNSNRSTQEPQKGKYRTIWAVVTAYCPCARCCGRGSPGRTSLGKSAWKPGIAADPRAIPYGTKIFVKGYGTFVVDDTGGAMRRSWRSKGVTHLDIRMTYHWQARKWGRRYMQVRVYE